MKIAILANTFPPQQTGGAAMIAARQAALLEQAGHTIHIWRPEITWFAEPPFSRLQRHLKDLAPRKEIANEIIAWQPDILITHNLTGCGFGTPKAVQARGVRWIHVLHDVQLFEPSGRMIEASHTPWRAVWALLRRAALGKPNLVISPTAWLLELHQSFGFFRGTEMQVLPNPAPVASFVMRLPHDPFRLFMVGNTPEKGADFARGLAEQLEGAQLEVVDRMPNHEVIEKMKEADALLVPSQIAENQPTVILEAASVGLPVIASDIGGMKETLGNAGLLCSVNDTQGWIESVNVLRDPGVFTDLSSKMYELARAHDPENYTMQFLALIER